MLRNWALIIIKHACSSFAINDDSIKPQKKMRNYYRSVIFRIPTRAPGIDLWRSLGPKTKCQATLTLWCVYCRSTCSQRAVCSSSLSFFVSFDSRTSGLNVSDFILCHSSGELDFEEAHSEAQGLSLRDLPFWSDAYQPRCAEQCGQDVTLHSYAGNQLCSL